METPASPSMACSQQQGARLEELHPESCKHQDHSWTWPKCWQGLFSGSNSTEQGDQQRKEESDGAEEVVELMEGKVRERMLRKEIFWWQGKLMLSRRKLIITKVSPHLHSPCCSSLWSCCRGPGWACQPGSWAGGSPARCTLWAPVALRPPASAQPHPHSSPLQTAEHRAEEAPLEDNFCLLLGCWLWGSTADSWFCFLVLAFRPS